MIKWKLVSFSFIFICSSSANTHTTLKIQGDQNADNLYGETQNPKRQKFHQDENGPTIEIFPTEDFNKYVFAKKAKRKNSEKITSKRDAFTDDDPLCANVDPAAVDDNFTVLQNTAIRVSAPGIIRGDSDSCDEYLRVISHSKPRNGRLVLQANGEFAYAPKRSYHGIETFMYMVSNDFGGASSARVFITVEPLAYNYTSSTLMKTELIIDTSDILANDLLEIISYTHARNGTVAKTPDGGLSYNPDAHFEGVDTFSYTVTDNRGGDASATISINVRHPNLKPIAIQDIFSIPQKTMLTIFASEILSNDYDEDGDSLTIESYSTPSNGTLIKNPDGGFTYVANENFIGIESIEYTINDESNANNANAKGLIKINVTPKNEAPVAKNDYFSTLQNDVLRVSASDLINNDKDSNGDALFILGYSDPHHGSVIKNWDDGFTYIPLDDFEGEDVFEYTVSDGKGGTDSAFIKITVEYVNKVPQGASDAFTTPINTELVILKEALLENDSDPNGNNMTIFHWTDPKHGSLAERDGSELVYRPDTDFQGFDMFNYTVSDSFGGIGTATVTITVFAEGIPNRESSDEPSTLDLDEDTNEITDEDTNVIINEDVNETTHNNFIMSLLTGIIFSYVPSFIFTLLI